MLLNDQKGEPIKCQCPKGKKRQMHHVQCPWYNPNLIYIIDLPEDLSPSELAAQQKIYSIYQILYTTNKSTVVVEQQLK